MSFDGSIYATIGADMSDYNQAMNEVASMTKKAFETASKAASQSSNQMIREIGKLMNELVSNTNSTASKVGQGVTGVIKISLGELQRITSNIGAKLPEPIQKAFKRTSNEIKSVLESMRMDIASFGTKANKVFKDIFNFDIARAMKSPANALWEISGATTKASQRIANVFSNIGNLSSSIGSKLPAPFSTAFNAIANGAKTLESNIRTTGSNLASSIGRTATSKISQEWSDVFTKISSKAEAFVGKLSNSLGGRLLSASAKLGTSLSNGLGNAFSAAGSKAVSALTSITNHTNRAASASSNLIKSVVGIGLAYKAFDLVKQGITSTVSKAADFESKMSNIKAVTGESAETMKKFNDAAIKAGADTAFSASEAADAIGELAKAGVSTADILNGGLTASLDLATAGELDLKEAAEITSTALNAFKRDGMTATQAANQLAGAANASATDVHELKYGLSMVAPVASGLGLTFRDTTNALAVFAQNGLKGSDAGTSLKTMLMNLQPQTKKQYNAMRDLGIITEDGANKFFTAEGQIKSFAEISQVLKEQLGGLTDAEKQMALKTMFGTDAVRAATIAMNEGADGANKMQSEIDKVTAAQVAAEKLNNLKGAVEGLSGSFETLQIKLGTAVLPILTTLVKAVDRFVDKLGQSKAVDSFINMLNTLNPALNQLLNGVKMSDEQLSAFQGTFSKLKPVIAGVVGAFAFGPAVKNLTKLTGVLGEISGKVLSFGSMTGKAFSMAGGFINSFSFGLTNLPSILSRVASSGLSVLGMMTNGISSVMGVALAAIGPAAILGLVLAGLGLVNSQFSTQINQLLNTVSTKGPEIIQNLAQGITSQIPILVSSGANLVHRFAEAFASVFPTLVQTGVDIIGSLVQGVGQNATSLISSAVTIIGSFIVSIASALPQLLSMGVELIANLVQGLLNNLPQIMQTAQEAVTTFLSGLGSQMPNIIAKGIEILQNLINGAIQMLPTLLDIAVQVITSFIQGIVSNLPQILQGGIQLIISLVQGIINNLPKIAQSAVQIIGELIKGLAQSLPQIIAAGLQLIVQLAMALITGLPKIAQAGWDLIVGLGKAMLEAIPEAIGGAVKEVGNFFGGLWDFVTGKNTEGSAKTKATMDDMSNHISTKTAEASANAKANTQDMTTGVSANMDALNNNTLTQMGILSTNVDTNMQGLVTSTGINMDTLNNNVNATFTQANINATAQTAQMQQNVSANVSALNADASAQLQSLQGTANNSLANVQSVATTNASATNANVTSNFNQMQSSASSATSSMASSVNGNLNQVASNAQSSTSQVAQTVTANFNKADQTVKSVMSNMVTTAKNGLNQIANAAKNGGQQVSSTFTSTFNTVRSTVTSGMNSVVSSFRSAMNQTVNAAHNANSQIEAVFNSLAGQLNAAGYYAGMGLYGGLASTAGSLYALAASIASNIASTISRALDIHSPSRVTEALGSYTGEGMYNGMAKWVKHLEDMSKQYALAITDQEYQSNSVLATSATVTGGGVSTALDNLSDEVKNTRLAEPQFEVHNELVGDEIYTTIKEKDARNRALDDFFVYGD